MVLFNWLGRLASGLFKLAKRGGAGASRGSRMRRRVRNDSHVAAIERLEPRQLLSAIMVVDDSFQLPQQSPLGAPSIVLEVLGNDSSVTGGLTITSVQQPMYGSVTIQHDLISAMMGLPPAPDTLLFTPAYGFTGTETLTYTVTDAAGDQSTATVTLTVTAATSSSGSGSSTGGSGSSTSDPWSMMSGGSSTGGSSTDGFGTTTGGTGSGGTSTGGNTSTTGTGNSGQDDPLTLEEQLQQLTDQVTKAQGDLAAGKASFDSAISDAQAKLKQQQQQDEQKHADALAKARQKLDEKVTAGHDKATAAMQQADTDYRDAVTTRLTAAVNSIVTGQDPLASTSTAADQQDQTPQPPAVDPAEALGQYMQWVAGAFGTPGSSDPMTGTTTGSLGTFQMAVKGDAQSAFDELRGDANVERDALVAADTDYITALTADQTAYLDVYHGLQQSLQTAVNDANNRVNTARDGALATYHQRQQQIASMYNSSMMTTMSMDDYMAQSAARQAAENGAKCEYMTTVGRAELTAAQTVGDKYIAAVQSERPARATLAVALLHDENVRNETQAAAKTTLQDQTDVTLARVMDDATALEGGYATLAEQKYTTFESKVALAEETAVTSQQSANNSLVTTTVFGIRIGNWQDQAARFGAMTSASVGFGTTTIDAFGGYLTAEHDADFAALVATHRREEAQLKSILESDTALATAGAAARVAQALTDMRDDLQRLLASDNNTLSQVSPDQMGTVLGGLMRIPTDFTSPTAAENFAAAPDATPEQAAATQSARTLIDQAAATT